MNAKLKRTLRIKLSLIGYNRGLRFARTESTGSSVKSRGRLASSELCPSRRLASNGIAYQCCRWQRSEVGSESANESAVLEGVGGGDGRAVIACWVIYLVILADRPREPGAWATERTRGLLTPYPRGGGKRRGRGGREGEGKRANHRHWWKLKTHFITRLIPRPPPSARPPSSVASTLDLSLHGLSPLLTPPSFPPPSCYLTRPLFSLPFTLRPPLIIFRRSAGASFARTDLIWGRPYLMERILLKFACTRNRWNIVGSPLSIPFATAGYRVDLSFPRDGGPAASSSLCPFSSPVFIVWLVTASGDIWVLWGCCLMCYLIMLSRNVSSFEIILGVLI